MQRPTAFIVEDQMYLATLYEDTLRLVGFDIIISRDGLEALNKLEITDIPTMILLDVNIPGLSGKDLHKHIRGKERFKDVPVLIATANSVAAASMQAELVENDTLMVKPIGMRDLQQFAKAAVAKASNTPDDEQVIEKKEVHDKSNIAQAVSASIQQAKIKGIPQKNQEADNTAQSTTMDDDDTIPNRPTTFDIVPELKRKVEQEVDVKVLPPEQIKPDRYATSEVSVLPSDSNDTSTESPEKPADAEDITTPSASEEA